MTTVLKGQAAGKSEFASPTGRNLLGPAFTDAMARKLAPGIQGLTFPAAASPFSSVASKADLLSTTSLSAWRAL